MANAAQRRVKMSIVPNDQMKEAAALAEQEAAAAADVPAKPEGPAAVPARVFSEHIVHAAATMRRASIEVDAIDLCLEVLRTELLGCESSATDSIAQIRGDAEDRILKVQREADTDIARINERLIQNKTTLTRRIEDLELTRDMTQAQIDVHAKRNPPKIEERSNAQTDAERDPAGTGEAGGADGDTQEPGAGSDA